jgi:hypothetical protein
MNFLKHALRASRLGTSAVGFLVASSALVACGGDDTLSPTPTPTATVPVTPPPPVPTTTTKRTLVEGQLVPTAPKNLLLDPGFFLTEQGGQITGAFLALFEANQDQATVTTRIDSTSPAGFGGGVLAAKDPKATDEKSRSLQLIAGFTGGPGPFTASVWVSSVDAAGNPRPFPEDGGGFAATVIDSTQATAGTLRRDPAKTKTLGNRVWALYSGTWTKALVGGGLFSITTGNKGGGFDLASPEVVPADVKVLSLRAPIAIRPMSDSERSVAAKMAALPPRLRPAGAPDKSVPRLSVAPRTK